MCLVLAYLSDWTNIRVPYVLLSSALLIAGLAILLTTHANFSAQYAGICLVCMGAFGAGPIVICWYLMNLEGHKQRGIGSGWMISFGNTGGILAPFAFLPKDRPYYHPGYVACMIVTVVGVVATLCYTFLVIKERRRVHKDDGNKDMLALSL